MVARGTWHEAIVAHGSRLIYLHKICTKCALAAWAYALETVHDAVRRTVLFSVIMSIIIILIINVVVLHAGFNYAGLQYGKECWCGDSYGKHNKMAEEHCGTKCAGQPNTTCGGYLATRIFKTGYGSECVMVFYLSMFLSSFFPLVLCGCMYLQGCKLSGLCWNLRTVHIHFGHFEQFGSMVPPADFFAGVILYGLSPWVCRVVAVGCLMSQQHASISQEQICSDSCICYHTETEVADQTFCLTWSQYTDTRPARPSADLLLSA